MDHKESWAPKIWCFQIVVLETLESPLDCKEVKPVFPKGNQPWVGKTEAEAEAPILWSPDAKTQLIGKDPDAGKDWGKEEKRGQRMRWLGSITDLIKINFVKLQEIVKERGAWREAAHGVSKSQTWLSHWTTTAKHSHPILLFFISSKAFPLRVNLTKSI